MIRICYIRNEIRTCQPIGTEYSKRVKNPICEQDSDKARKYPKQNIREKKGIHATIVFQKKKQKRKKEKKDIDCKILNIC